MLKSGVRDLLGSVLADGEVSLIAGTTLVHCSLVKWVVLVKLALRWRQEARASCVQVFVL